MAGIVSVCECGHAHLLELSDDGEASFSACPVPSCDCPEMRLAYQTELREGKWVRV